MLNLSEDYKPKYNKIIGTVHKNIDDKEFKVLNYYLNSKNNSKKVLIEFTVSGYITLTTVSIVKNGRVIDRLSPTVCGVGSLGYASYKDNEKMYNLWKGMLRRCYDSTCREYKFYGELGISVCEEWLRFDYFLGSVKNVDGYDEELFNNGILQLDKDLKQRGILYDNKIYSPNTCTFMSKSKNKSLAKAKEKGVCIKVINTITKEILYFNSMLSFANKYDLNRKCVSKHLNTNNVYKNWIISEVNDV